ncbi:hypothetical protein CAPTEDRAFT_227441 [Capitella teleta]|uniref:PDZ domain-containing protein n=1 Tax=Capitella teleta TaxID=283909 RepID=R7UB94_CAPTE|nr:hypothetical protein CAPTEDRAFT_227441 [Capitella teleta]|eukprot:ELU00522.1 hypothetical protein CAPTEDRAFT_227441 [Capitella teleta]
MSSLLCNSHAMEDKENAGCVGKKSSGKRVLPGKAHRTPFGSRNAPLANPRDTAVTSTKPLVSRINADVNDMDSYTVVLKRGRHGYGFSVLGSSPVRVSSVKPDSPAHFAGLQRGDCVVKINGQNVSRSMADSVATIVRHSEKQIIMDIHRTDNSDNMSVTSEVSQYPCPEDEPRPMPTSFHNQMVSSSVRESRPLSMMQSASPSRDISASTLSLHCAIPHVDRALQQMGNTDRERDLAVQKLQNLEYEYVQIMERGINGYLTPFKSCAISPSEHQTLFQNIEQLMSFSVHHLTKLQDCHSSQMTLQADVAPGVIYQPWVDAMAEAYESYCNGIKSAFRLLLELSENPEFKGTLKEFTRSANGLSISQFLQKPLMHIKTLVLSFQQIALSTPLDHYEYKHVKFVIETLRSACNRINDNNTRRSPSVLSLASNSPKSSVRSASPEAQIPPSTPSEHPVHMSETDSLKSSLHSERSNQTKSSSDQSMISIASVDSEVMDIQTRLVLPDHMPPLLIATATRHMIYSGDLFYFDGLLWKKLFVVLLNDLMLLTQADYEGLLTLWTDPILLDNIQQIAPLGSQVCEFTLHVNQGVDPMTLQFQAPTIDLKATWINLLDQRISSFKSQAAQAAMMDNIV